MKLIAKIVMFSLCIANVHAELLIIKRVQPQTAAASSSSSRASQPSIAPLDASDESNYPAIAQVLLNYQWPMVIANLNLTPAEQNELLTENFPNAEENFIRRKLEEINPAYDVAFIPTCVYELFILIQNNEWIEKTIKNMLGELSEENIDKKLIINILDEINGKGPLHNPRQDVYNVFKAKNALYYKKIFFEMNNKIVQFLSQLIDFSDISKEVKLSEEIKIKIKKINKAISSKIFKDSKPLEFYSQRTKLFDNPNQFQLIIKQMIEIEYNTRQSNLEFLLRGSNLVSLKRNDENIFKIIGTTITEMDVLQDIQKAYKNDSNLPYSISFGNSLFAGFFLDYEACVAHYLNKTKHSYGYVLFLNKKKYIKDQSSSLFFISPLAPIAALFSSGEFFHSRTKICNRQNISDTDQIRGLTDYRNIFHPSNFIDHDHIITTTNNPLVNAKLFSYYLIKNMYIITVPQDQKSFSTREEERINLKTTEKQLENLYKNQQKAADYYKAINTLGKVVPKWTNKQRQKIDYEKALKEELQCIEGECGKTSMETELS